MAKVLIVDDDAMVVRIIRIALERADYQVMTASSGSEAALISSGEKRIDLIIVNHRIAPDRGRDIAERTLTDHPEMKVIHVSGFTRAHLEDEGAFTPGAGFLQKPFTMRTVQRVVAEMLK